MIKFPTNQYSTFQVLFHLVLHLRQSLGANGHDSVEIPCLVFHVLDVYCPIPIARQYSPACKLNVSLFSAFVYQGW